MAQALSRGAAAVPYAHDSNGLHWVKDHGVDIPGGKRHWPVVAFVRNPYARELSFYLWHQRHDRDPVHLAAKAWNFKRFMRWRINHMPNTHILRRTTGTQSRYLLGTHAKILRYEDLPGAFEDLFDVPLHHSHETANQEFDPLEYYDDETMELMRCYAGADFLNYGYDPEVLP
jgi:hypothetical protein